MKREELVDLLERDERLFPRARANADPGKDRTGQCADLLGLTLRGHGVARFALSSDAEALRAFVRESILIAVSLFERASRGEPIHDCFLSMLAYKDLFDALAIGDTDLAKAVAQHMGGREEIEHHYDSPFDRAMGYCLRAFVLGNESEMRNRSDEFRRECEEKDNADFRGYATVFEAILERDSDQANQGFVELLKGHRRQCKGNGVFRFTPDEDLCVWGLGMANLARSYGLDIRISDPLIPSELII